MLSSGVHVNVDWAAQNPQLLKAFLRALLSANREVYANPQVLYDAATTKLKLAPDVAKAAADSDLRYKIWEVNGGLTPDNLQYTVDFLKSIKALPDGVTVEDVADLSLLNEVVKEIGRQ